MKRLAEKKGLTLIEIVVTVAVIVILASIVIGTAVRIETHSKEQLMENTFALINAALTEFKEYGFKYDPRTLSDPLYQIGTPGKREFYLGLDFPVDCNDYVVQTGLYNQSLMLELALAFGSRNVLITFVSNGASHQNEYSGCEAMYFVLRRVPQCRRILDKIDNSLITNADPNVVELKIQINNEEYPLDRIIDPWSRTLRYDYYDERESNISRREKSKRTFPMLISAGADGIFDTRDDMKSRKR